eukprot:TRINITY_DN6266_c0_g1_i3.p1 TRINITY_DN6266_c0_g1~~TRINITY_DN6266_c0_g1_i3.p1  ORF type:complete len:378 (-),score=59.21 TRINITY_DN6266_c0_g1_i3:102-1235(-)
MKKSFLFVTNLPLSYVLVEDLKQSKPREEGSGGMYLKATLKYLCNIQNKFLEVLEKRIQQSQDQNEFGGFRLSSETLDVFKLSKDHIITAPDQNTLRDVLQKSISLCPELGKGSIIEYDWNQINPELFKQILLNKPKLSSNKLLYFNYQGESSSLPNLFLSISNSSRQVPLPKACKDKLETELAKMKEDNVDTYGETLKTLFSSLRLVMYYLSNHCDEKIAKLKLGEYVEIVSFPQEDKAFCKKVPFGDVELSYIVDYYNFIEEKLYDHKENDEEGDIFDEDGLVESDITALIEKCKRGTLPKIEDFLKLMKKFTMRRLGEVSDLDEPLREGMGDYDSWWDGTEEIYRSLKANIPISLKVKHIRALSRKLSERLQSS